MDKHLFATVKQTENLYVLKNRLTFHQTFLDNSCYNINICILLNYL